MNIKTLKNIYLFSDFSDSDLNKIAGIAEVKDFLPGQDIFTVGQTASAIYIVIMGTVKISVNTGEGDEIQIRTMGSGSHFGEMPFIDGDKRSASVQTLEPSHLAEIPYEKLTDLLDNDVQMAAKFYRSIAKYLAVRLRTTTSDLNSLKELKFQQ